MRSVIERGEGDVDSKKYGCWKKKRYKKDVHLTGTISPRSAAFAAKGVGYNKLYVGSGSRF